MAEGAGCRAQRVQSKEFGTSENRAAEPEDREERGDSKESKKESRLNIERRQDRNPGRLFN